MTAWKTGEKKSSASKGGFRAEILKLAADIKMVGDGKVMIAKATFREWRAKLKAVAASEKAELAEQLLILAGRYFREVGEQATQAVAQLLVLAGDLTRVTNPVVATEPTIATRAAAAAKAPVAKKAAPAPAKKSAPAAAKKPAGAAKKR